MQVGQSFIGSNPLREHSRALATNIAVVENQLGQEAFVWKSLAKGVHAQITDQRICQSYDSERFNILHTLCNFSEAFVSYGIVVEVQLWQFILVRYHGAERKCSISADVVVI